MGDILDILGAIALILIMLAFGLGYKIGHDEGIEDGWKLRGMFERKGE